MIERVILVYVFLSFSTGLVCLGIMIALARRKGATLARAFLAFYASLSVLVLSALLLSFVHTQPSPPGASTRLVLEYLESMIGTYAVLFTLPLFVHRLFGITDGRRDRILLAIALFAALGQHLTEYVLPGVWDARGDLAENVLFLAVMAYTFLVAASRVGDPGIDRRLAALVLTVAVVAVPGLVHDLFFTDDTPLRIYPFLYCLLSVVVTWNLARRPSPTRAPAAEASWGLSNRETEVLRLVQRGMSNKDIGAELHISPNTVKTHLRAVFEKTGSRSRFQLISLGRPENAGDHPEG